MAVDIFLFFNGDCRQALEFYAKVFKQEFPKQVMTYAQNPEGASDADKDRIIYACMPMYGNNMMFSDCPNGRKVDKGNNFAVTVGLPDADELKRIFNDLSEDGEINMPLGKTFFSELFGMVCDKFGIIWQLSLTAE